jgi:hypothetical protein
MEKRKRETERIRMNRFEIEKKESVIGIKSEMKVIYRKHSTLFGLSKGGIKKKKNMIIGPKRSFAL